MNKLTLHVLLVALLAMAGGCGLKGDLYLERQAQQEAVTEGEGQTEDQAEDQAEEKKTTTVSQDGEVSIRELESLPSPGPAQP